MKKPYIFTALAVLGLMFLSCAKEGDDQQEISGPHFTLNLQIPGSDIKNVTKATTQNGVKSLNENRINSIYYYFFADTDASATALVSGHFLGLNLDGDLSAEATRTWKLPISVSVVSKLFPSGARNCRMFIVANPPSDIVSELNENSPTLGHLRNLTFTSSLSGTQKNFVMVCDNLVEAESRTGDNAFTADATLKRVANKISVTVRTVNQYVDPTTKDEWNPLIDKLKVEFHNGMNKANLAGDFTEKSADEDDFFNAESGFSSTVSYNYVEISESEIPAEILSSLGTSDSLPDPDADADQYVHVGDKFYSLLKSSSSTN